MLTQCCMVRWGKPTEDIFKWFPSICTADHILHFISQQRKLENTPLCEKDLNSDPAKWVYLLEVVSRYRDPQLQVGENYSHLFNLRPHICK